VSGAPASGARRRHWVDAAVAALAFAVEASGAALTGRKADEPDLTALGVLLLLGETLPLLGRRRNPVLVVFVSGAFAGAYGIAELPDVVAPLGVLVALATVVQSCSRRTAVVIGLVSVAAGMLSSALAGDADAQDYWLGLVSVAAAWLIGDRQRARAERLAELQDRAARLVADRHRELADARAAERTRLSRELHDVVAHHVSMMVVQAEAGAAAAGDGPGSAAFDGIAGTGRQALTELRRLLTILRSDEPAASTEPQPGVEQIAVLVDQVRSAGLDVELRSEGTPRPLPAGVALSAYRVVQEGLTNVLKHAGRARATVTVRYRPDSLELVVRDDGSADGPPADGRAGRGGREGAGGGRTGGFGLTGLRERVALFGGRLEAGPGEHGGFELDVHLPIGT
jgi:signal transduction histidine kinase